MCPQNYFKKERKHKIKMETFTIFGGSLETKPELLVDFEDHIFITVFPKHLFWFSTLNSKISRKMYKLHHNVCNGQN